MLPIQLGDTFFQFGHLQIPYANVTAAGVALKRRRVGVFKSLLIAYRLPGDAKLRRINFRLQSGGAGEQLTQQFRARVGDRWQGEADYFALRKAMGLPSAPVFAVVAVLVLLSVGITAALLFHR